jgi:hypothetical protein
MEDLTSLLSNGRDTADISETLKINPESQFETLNNSMRSELAKKVEDFKGRKWTIPVRNGEMDIGDVVENFVDIAAGAKNFVGARLSANPHAALAWSVVCFGLQVSRPPFYPTKILVQLSPL